MWRRVALLGCLGVAVGSADAQILGRAERSVEDEIKEHVIEKIYSFQPVSGWTNTGKDPSLAFRIYDAFSLIEVNPFDPPLCRGATYGEITREGIELLAEKLGLRDNPAETFYDLGSGAGRAVLHMCAGEYVSSACHGIEFSASRNDAANVLKTEILRVARSSMLGRKLANQVTFEQGDLQEKDFSDATLIWTDNLCFPEKVSKAMGQKILTYPKVQTVAAMKEIPGLEGSGFERTDISLPMTFGDDDVDVYLYRRSQK